MICFLAVNHRKEKPSLQFVHKEILKEMKVKVQEIKYTVKIFSTKNGNEVNIRRNRKIKKRECNQMCSASGNLFWNHQE